MVFDTSTIITIIITNIFVGLGIAVGFWWASKSFLKRIIKEVPHWIHEILSEQRENAAIDRAIEARKNY